LASLILTAQLSSYTPDIVLGTVTTTNVRSATQVVQAEEIKSVEPKAKETKENMADLIRSMAEHNGVNADRAVAIAKCESNLRQFDKKTGKVLRGQVIYEDVGLFQINEKFHLEASKKAGYDIYTPEGNIGYALFLLKNEGAQHWNASRSCWEKYI
jgi:ABC-type enterochelin transport system substrate-binding protein